MKTYIKPSIKLLESTNELSGFYVWLKSREKVIKSKDGNPIQIKYRGFTSLPDEFYVGAELVNKHDYMKRINDMNLQFNNMPQYLFEIHGSCLFRDLLFNINKTAMWSESNRFLFSILPDDAIYDESRYPISNEYKGIKEWEDQFDEYMEKIKEDPITDNNRPKMPYSISSLFWWGCNYKTLINLLSMLKLKMPFFYEVYGRKMMKISEISEDELKPFVDSSLQQYFRCDNWKRGMVKNSDFYILNIDISYVILSQFLRQSDVVITGLFSDLEHNDSEEFSHKVFKGETVCNVTYVANKFRVLQTVSKRCCNFAANSGDGPGSWSHILKVFLDSVNTPDELRDVLPCKFDNNGLLKYCPLWDDVKYRNEGLEKRNCVCPLTTCKMEDAQKKLDRDKNKLGKLFYDLTEDLVNKGGSEYKHDLKNK